MNLSKLLTGGVILPVSMIIILISCEPFMDPYEPTCDRAAVYMTLGLDWSGMDVDDYYLNNDYPNNYATFNSTNGWPSMMHLDSQFGPLGNSDYYTLILKMTFDPHDNICGDPKEEVLILDDAFTNIDDFDVSWFSSSSPWDAIEMTVEDVPVPCDATFEFELHEPVASNYYTPGTSGSWDIASRVWSTTYEEDGYDPYDGNLDIVIDMSQISTKLSTDHKNRTIEE